MPDDTTVEKFAILIGVSLYPRPLQPKSSSIPHLSGAVSGAERMETLLRANGVTNIRKLTSTAPETHDVEKDPPGAVPTERPEDQPTYVNIRAAIEGFITADATKRKGKPGDIVYFLFSGHGHRTASGRTAYPGEDWKGPSACDESLVPSDVALNRQLLDDVTLA